MDGGPDRAHEDELVDAEIADLGDDDLGDDDLDDDDLDDAAIEESLQMLAAPSLPAEQAAHDGSLRTVVVVLAAGAGSRFSGDTHKLDAVVGDRTVAEHAIIAAAASGVGDVIVITGASEPAESVMESLASIGMGDTGDGTVQFIHHPGWADGQASSLQVALAEAVRVGADALVVGLADQPGVTAEAWQRVAASTSPIAVATYDGQRGNPVRLHQSIWPELPTTGDEGARSLMRLRPELVEQIPCPGSAHDIDTREDLQLWQSRSSTSSP